MKLILSHPMGNNFSRALAYQLFEEKKLFDYYTSFATFENSLLYKLGGLAPFADIRRRCYKKPLKPYVRTSPIYEIARLLSLKLGLSELTKHETGLFCVDSVYQRIDKLAAAGLASARKNGVNGIYAYEDGALESFKKAKSEGLTCVYDLPIAYWKVGRKLMAEESERLPAWSQTIGGGIHDSLAKLEKKDDELRLADIVVTPSDFVVDTLPDFARTKKIVVSPFGSPVTTYDGLRNERSRQTPLRVLFAGSMGQRKGLSDLFAAINLLKGQTVELVVMGNLLAPVEFYRSELPHFSYEPGRAHDKVLELMRSCDVFCLPSIVEGRALVMQEAMSQGLPIIITPNTGGSDLIVDGKTGFLVPIRSPHAIAEKINWFIENRDAIPEMRRWAQLRAAEYTWNDYSERIITSIADFITSQNCYI